jgi:anaerobic selenocysteine-containing dehydrogenase
MIETHPSICRFCHAHCPILVDIEDGRPLRVQGDRSNPIYHGYTCPKGRSLPEQHTHPERLLHSRKRRRDGSHEPIPSERAIDEIATRVQRILDEHGPRSVAIYTGTYSFPYPAAAPVAFAWMNAIRSPMRFTSATIDQPGKMIAPALHGNWMAGAHPFESADTWMIFGANPTIAKSVGAPPYNPAWYFHDAIARGMKLIVVDPRRTEAAKIATLHLQPRPGEDPTIVAGLIRVILREGLHDEAFVRENAVGLEALRETVEPFTPKYVARRADVPAKDLVRAARIFSDGRRGGAYAGTGPNMSPRGNLTEYLLLCLNTLCGRWLREGEPVPNPGVLTTEVPARAEPIPPMPAWGFGEKMRVRGLANTAAGLPTAALADEILLEGDGQVKALFCLGGNPMAAWPDQRRTFAALKKLELLVTFDIKMSATAKLAHYVIAPKLSLEQPGMTLGPETLTSYSMGYNVPYGQYVPALVDPPAGSDVIEEWQFFYRLARHMGLPLSVHSTYTWIPGGPKPIRTQLDMEHEPTTDELFEYLTAGSRIPLDEVKRHPHGFVFDEPPSFVLPKSPTCAAKLDLANPAMMVELREIARGEPEEDPRFPFRLVCRRLLDVHNSAARDIPRLTRKYRYNPAFVHPDDLRTLGVEPGDVIEIESSYDSILGIVEADPTLRRGLISMPHSFGDAPTPENDALVRHIGSNTGRLSPVDRDYDPYHGMPVMSTIPVSARRYEGFVAD